MLPPQIRDRSKRKLNYSNDDNDIKAAMDEEEKDDLTLFNEIVAIKNCFR
jgi:hypothetical protein